MIFIINYMSRLILVKICVLVVPSILFAQIGWTKHTIAPNFVGAQSVYAIDMEPDGDIDVVGAAYEDCEIAWWENDGNENFTGHIIAPYFDGASYVYAIDLDDDRDMDNDNDVDVLGAAVFVDEITWWENDGNENFTKHIIDGNFGGAWAVYAIDLDDDSDVDVLGTAIDVDEVAWWENDGNENFTKHIIDANFAFPISVYAIDMDNDNDVDVLGAAYDANDITWWENDGNENFTKHTIDGNFIDAWSVYAIDMDNDNDVDVLGAAVFVDEITWWENDGNENFTKHIIDGNFDGSTSVYAIDMDDDRDVDVLGAAYWASDITWWESDLATFVAEEDLGTPEAFKFRTPTLSRGKAEIELILPEATKVDLLIYDTVGRLCMRLVSKRFSAGTHSLNINLALPSGVYFYNLKTESGRDIITKFLLVD